MTFTNFNFLPQINTGISEAGYSTPTPIQIQSIPPILEGRDVLGLAQTGTGKTAAFVLPILQRLMKGPRGRLRALIISPTRELAEQIHMNIKALGSKTGLRSITVYGGVGANLQISGLRGGAEIVVACPGRLLDLMNQGFVNPRAIEVLVLDEADHMFDMGFLPNIKRILAALPTERQTLLFSATMPAEIRDLATHILKNPVTVEIGITRPLDTVSHMLYPVEQTRKIDLLQILIRDAGKGQVLVFTRTKHRARRVAEQLIKAGVSATSLQGNLSQNRRQEAMDGFRSGRWQVMVATDIAARGIDVSKISHVINYDLPDTADAYTHRTGRTGRMENLGKALSLITDEDADMVRTIERLFGHRLERQTLEGFDNTPRPASQNPVPETIYRSGNGRRYNGNQGRGGSNQGRSNSNPPSRPSQNPPADNAQRRTMPGENIASRGANSGNNSDTSRRPAANPYRKTYAD